MADVQKPVETTEAPVAPAVEPTAAPVVAPAETLAADKPAETVEPATEEPAKTEGEAAAPVEEKKEEKPVEPIYSGALGYKAPGLKNVFRFSKKYFWFGEEPVPVSSLSQFLRGEKDAEHAHTVAAWSSVTGKGLLYFVKHADQKDTPAGVLKLADATDLTKDGTVAFFFKLHGHKHAFEASTLPERNSWFVAFEKAIEEAKAESETIVANETYQEQLGKLGKPATLAATAAKESTAPKKSTDVAPKLGETEAPATEAAVPDATRTGSASSDSSNEEKRKKKAKSKSRSASRGKRASIFGGFLGKKEKLEEKKEEKKEEHEEKKEEKAEEAEEKKAEEVVPPVTPLAESSTVAAPVLVTDLPKPTEEAKTEEAAAPAAPATEDKPKPAKRASIFGNFVEKLRSPTAEKKEADLVAAPVPAVKEGEASEAPKTEEPVAPVTEATTEAPKVDEAKPATTTPHKEKSSFSFGKFLGGKEKVKSPTTEKAPTSEAPKLEDPIKTDEAPVLAPVEPVAPIEPAAVTEAPKEEEATPAVATTPPQKKRGSIFGNLTGGSVKKEKDGEASEKKGLSGLFRSASKAAKSKKDEKTTPAKVDEAEAKEDVPPVPAVPATEEKKEAAAEPAIGDVTADAVTVGQAPKSASEVATTA